MEYRWLGTTGLRVSRVCFGALTIGRDQANLSLEEGSRVILRALDRGINFIDTAECYGTYHYIRRALQADRDREVIVASKSYAYTEPDMRRDLYHCLDSLDRERVEIFLLHEQESRLTLEGHRPALEYLLKAKEAGLVAAVGISTHTVAAVRAAAEMPEIDVIHPLINREGLGIADGGREEMLEAISTAHSRGKGIYAMKALGGGHLIPDAENALKWVLDLPCVDAVAVGMQSEAEIEVNAAWCEGGQAGERFRNSLASSPRKLVISEGCRGCMECSQRCSLGAISLVDGKAEVDIDRCILCSYCAQICPDFCIKIV